MRSSIREYRSAEWPAICRVHDLSRPDELRGSFDPRAFIPLAEDPEHEYIADCEMGENAGYEGPAARPALDPERKGWTKPKRSQTAGGDSG